MMVMSTLLFPILGHLQGWTVFNVTGFLCLALSRSLSLSHTHTHTHTHTLSLSHTDKHVRSADSGAMGVKGQQFPRCVRAQRGGVCEREREREREREMISNHSAESNVFPH